MYLLIKEDAPVASGNATAVEAVDGRLIAALVGCAPIDCLQQTGEAGGACSHRKQLRKFSWQGDTTACAVWIALPTPPREAA